MQLGRYSVCHWGGTQHATWADPNEAIRTGGLRASKRSPRSVTSMPPAAGPLAGSMPRRVGQSSFWTLHSSTGGGHSMWPVTSSLRGERKMLPPVGGQERQRPPTRTCMQSGGAQLAISEGGTSFAIREALSMQIREALSMQTREALGSQIREAPDSP
jgi:hypothetical protein